MTGDLWHRLTKGENAREAAGACRETLHTQRTRLSFLLLGPEGLSTVRPCGRNASGRGGVVRTRG